jgi:hypothetical protein
MQQSELFGKERSFALLEYSWHNKVLIYLENRISGYALLDVWQASKEDCNLPITMHELIEINYDVVADFKNIGACTNQTILLLTIADAILVTLHL